MSLLLRTDPAPGFDFAHSDGAFPSVYFGVRVEAAVNLLEAREYQGLGRAERLHKALEEQRSFLNNLLDPSLKLVVDLRTRVRPDSRPALEVALLGRVWEQDQRVAEERARSLQRHLLASLPRHVIGSAIEETGEIVEWLSPFRPDAEIDAAMVTRREVTGKPQRPDAKVAYYFSVVPFSWVEADWTNLYSALSASPVPLVVSVALLPTEMPSAYTSLLEQTATYYGRLAKEDRLQGGLYFGERTIPPDAFAIDAERVFRDYARRYSGRVFAMRIEVAAEGRLPAGIAESLAATVSPGDSDELSPYKGERAASSYEIRRAGSDYERQLARWDLETLDVRLFDGSAEIWGRPDPPPPRLASLCTLGDARDTSCAFRLPVAVDGTVPGFKVRRGEFGHVESTGSDGPAIQLGQLPGRDDSISLPIKALTKHALVAGSTGSGKTTTVLEILRQLWLDHRVPFLVIEPVNSDADDYRRLLAEPGFERLEVLTVGDEDLRPLRFNPFEAPSGVIVGEHMANLLAAFKAAFGLWEPLPSIYQDALNLTYLDAGILSSERADGEARAWPTAVEFMQAMSKVTANLGYAGEVKSNIEAASIRRAQQLATGVSASAFLTDRPNDIAGLLDHPVIIELKSLGSGDEQALMIALLLNAVTEHYQAARGASSALEHVTVIEEAHRLLARPEGGRSQEEGQAKEKAAEAFANTLAENRKYGEGMIVAEQLPTKLVVDAVKNTNLKLMHRLTSEEDREYLGETMGLDESQKRYATRIVTGEALVYSDDFAEATLIEVTPRLTAQDPRAPEPSAAPPFSACAACRAQCEYRGAALAIVRDSDLVDELQNTMRYLEGKSNPAADQEKGWEHLLGVLRSRVKSFAVLPSEEPGTSDAAYCLFLHSLAIRRMHFSPLWPAMAAQRLGIAETATSPEAVGDGR